MRLAVETLTQPFSQKEEAELKVGLDVGSTTIKCVVLDDADNLVYSTYERHYSHILESRRSCCAGWRISTAQKRIWPSPLCRHGHGESVQVPFVQEVFATRVAANKLAPGRTASSSWR